MAEIPRDADIWGRNDVLTTVAIATLAFITADVAHELIGHGIGFVLAGGTNCTLTTTRIIEAQRLGDHGGDLFDMGGPAGNLGCAGAAYLVKRMLREPTAQVDLFLWLLLAFSLFWAFAYLIFCGVFAKGDWWALARGLPHPTLWQIILTLSGIALYRSTLQYLAAERKPSRIVVVSYLAAGCTACAGAVFDPWGPMEILTSGALSSFAASAGILFLARLSFQQGASEEASLYITARSRRWIVVSAVAAILYVTWLGPGIHVSW